MKNTLKVASIFLIVLLFCTACNYGIDNPIIIDPSASPYTDSGIIVPNLAGVDELSAKTVLLSKGLIPVVEYEYSSSIREGIVIRTNPSAESKIEVDTRITIYVSLGVLESTETPSETDDTPLETVTPTAATNTPSASFQPTPTSNQTSTHTAMPSVTSTPTNSPSPTPTPTPTPTYTPTPTPTATPTPTPTPIPTPTPVPTPKPYTREGNYIYFGSYPQSEVTDTSLNSILTEAAGDVAEWTSYDYYINDIVLDFLLYKDVSYNGQKYRGVYLASYRPYTTENSGFADESWQDENGYQINNVYWFKFEPIKWRILSESNGDAFLCSEKILDSQDFHYTKTPTEGHYPNNYEQSHIRAWLNDIFYNTAFSAEEKNAIKTTTVDNSLSTTGNSNDRYVCNNTNDKLFLLSYEDVNNSSYGFSSDSSRIKYPTTYAKVQGAQVDATYSCVWWLRSPDTRGQNARIIWFDGRPYLALIANQTSIGVVPALHLAL